jgi:hypothetical protein
MLCYECSKTGRSRFEDSTMIDFYSAAAQSFQEELDRIEKDGRKDSTDWYLAKGLLQLTQGLQRARDEEQDLRKSFARSWVPRN